MLKKIVIIIISVIFFNQVVAAKEVPVKITPVAKITTSNNNLQPGDRIDFLVINDVDISPAKYLKKGDKISGVLINREENGYLGQVAAVDIENFRLESIDGRKLKLKGVVYKKGTYHDIINGFTEVLLIYIRGGEVQLRPKKDVFTIYAEVK